jgi:hypothetical protein
VKVELSSFTLSAVNSVGVLAYLQKMEVFSAITFRQNSK